MARCILAASLSALGTGRAPGQSLPILMDGRFDDWPLTAATFTDNNAPATGIDLLSMQVANDEQYLFIRLKVGTEIDLQDDLLPQTIRLYIDADNNAATGSAVQSGYGAELQVRFDTRTVTEYLGTSSNVSWSTIDLIPLPTTTGTEFEIAIARNAMPDGVNQLFSAGTIKLLFRESDGGDAMPNSGTTLSYTFDATPTPTPTPITLSRNDPAHLRITAWNVLGDGITNAALQGAYQRILAALAPDVIGFSECVTSSAAQVKTRLDSWVPIGGAGWYVAKDDYDMVIAARWPITQSWSALSRQFATLIDLPSTYATDLLFTAAHLNCCTADATRQKQCDEYVQFVQDARSPGGIITVPANTPMVYAGDLNSVGYAQQLTTLLTGDIVNNATYGPDGTMDWDGSTLAAAELQHTHARMAHTWRNTGSAYPNGRLDHLFFTDAVAQLAKSFTLRTETMPAPTLAELGLQAGDAAASSDHFAITTDLALPLSGVRVNMRALLEGPYDLGTGLMHDSLRTKGLLPLLEPYTALGFAQQAGGGESTISQVLGINGADAVVDWVLLELRSATDPSTIVATRCALLQRDGDVVSTDGTSPVRFNAAAGSYHIALRHRNHLGIMTQVPLALGSTPVSIDLTLPGSAVYSNGGAARKAIGTVQVLWAGEVFRDGALRYVGANNDRDPVLVRVGATLPTNTAAGYFVEDVNMDGRVSYVGVGNDRDLVLVNVGGTTPNNTRAEQLP